MFGLIKAFTTERYKGVPTFDTLKRFSGKSHQMASSPNILVRVWAILYLRKTLKF
ncbi:hypothetical protein ACFLVP_03410 [Chloroflexota bacterium]